MIEIQENDQRGALHQIRRGIILHLSLFFFFFQLKKVDSGGGVREVFFFILKENTNVFQ